MHTASNIHYELSDRIGGIDTGGIGAIRRLTRHTGLVEEIDRPVVVLKAHLPYHESDHVLGIAYNILCGGRTRCTWTRWVRSVFPIRPLRATSAAGSRPRRASRR